MYLSEAGLAACVRRQLELFWREESSCSSVLLDASCAADSTFNLTQTVHKISRVTARIICEAPWLRCIAWRTDSTAGLTHCQGPGCCISAAV